MSSQCDTAPELCYSVYQNLILECLNFVPDINFGLISDSVKPYQLSKSVHLARFQSGLRFRNSMLITCEALLLLGKVEDWAVS